MTYTPPFFCSKVTPEGYLRLWTLSRNPGLVMFSVTLKIDSQLCQIMKHVKLVILVKLVKLVRLVKLVKLC